MTRIDEINKHQLHSDFGTARKGGGGIIRRGELLEDGVKRGGIIRGGELLDDLGIRKER